MQRSKSLLNSWLFSSLPVVWSVALVVAAVMDLVPSALAQGSGSSSSSSNSSVAVPTTPVPTFITVRDNDTTLKLTFFGIAFVVFGIPAVLSCVCFAARHRKRLAAVRALQERKNNRANNLTGSSDQTNLEASNINNNVSTSGHFSASAQRAANAASLQQRSAANAATPAVDTYDIDDRRAYDFHHSPPELSLVPLKDIHVLTPFTEDEAILQEGALGNTSVVPPVHQNSNVSGGRGGEKSGSRKVSALIPTHGGDDDEDTDPLYNGSDDFGGGGGGGMLSASRSKSNRKKPAEW